MSYDKGPNNMGPPPPYSPNSQAPLGFAQPPPTHQYPGPPSQTMYVQQPPKGHTSTVHVVAQAPVAQTTYVIPAGLSVGTCPACRVGILTKEFTCCGIFLGILFFPVGMLCCFLMMERRCTNCRAVYG